MKSIAFFGFPGNIKRIESAHSADDCYLRFGGRDRAPSGYRWPRSACDCAFTQPSCRQPRLQQTLFA